MPALLTWLLLLPQLLPLVVQSVQGIEGLVAAIKASQGLTPAQADALVATVRSGLAAENARVQAAPVP